jgi:uncharacterized membrane protein
MKKACHGPYILAALALLGLAVAFYDSYVIYNGEALWCPPPINGCNEVAHSPYARIFDVPVGYYGVVYYLAMFALAVLNVVDPASRALRLAVLAGAAVGVGFSAYFMILQVRFIHAFCVYCLISAVTTVLLLCVAVVHVRTMSRRIA